MEDHIGGSAVFDLDYFRAACNTLKASRWQVFKARWLGVKVTGEDDGHKVTGYWHDGKLYMTDYQSPRS